MMKCDMCYDRTSVGKQPMCTTVCPSRALHYGTLDEIEHSRPRSAPHNRFLFGQQEVRTKVYMMVPREAQPEYIDVLTALDGAGTPEPAPFRILSDTDPMLANLHSNPETG
jgi:Fe-S-cluster-containing dehydrogenase component